MPVRFYNTKGTYGCLSNFSRHGFQLDGMHWLTVEHYFQAQKFVGTEQFRAIQQAATPREAKDLGRSRAVPLRSDWDTVKDDIMRRAVQCKFEKHVEATVVLLDTGEEEIIEDSPTDFYWGCGADGTGKNMLGKILMELRAILRERAALAILETAVALPELQRVRLIEGLVASLANPEDFWEQQLAAELNRRQKEVKEGTAEPISWAELRKQLKK